MLASVLAQWRNLMAWLEPRPRALCIGSLASYVALAVFAFSYYSDALFYRFDGNFVLTLAATQRRWMAPDPGFSLNFLEALGDVWIPIATGWSTGFAVANLFAPERLPSRRRLPVTSPR